MSIAVSTVIKPSRLLRVALVVFATASAGAAMALLSGQFGRFHVPDVLAGACLLGSLVAWRAGAGLTTTRRIDISGLGEIRLTVQHSIGTTPGFIRGTPTPATPVAPALVRLVAGSTVWPGLLLLTLQGDEQGERTVLIILPDSVAPDEFRRIAVAINAIARRDNKFFRNNKIL